MNAGNIIGLIIAGLIIGALGRLLIPGRNPIGFLLTILVGIVGALVGGYIGMAINAAMWLWWVIAIVIAAILVALISALQRRNTVP